MDFSSIPYLGESAALAASLVWSCSITLYRAHGKGLPAQTLNLFKLCVALIGYGTILAALYGLPALGLASASLEPKLPATSSTVWWLMLSGILGLTIGDTLFFAAIGRLGAQLTAAIQCLTPPLNALIDWVCFDKVLAPMQMAGLLVTIVAVAAVILSGSPVSGLKPGSRGWWWGLCFAVLSAVFNAISYSMTAELVKGENVFICSVIRISPAMLLLLAPAIFSSLGRQGVKMMFAESRRALYLTLAAFLGTVLGITLLTFAFQHANTGIVSTLATTYPIWVIPVASFFLKEHPRPVQIACTVLAVVGIALLVIPNK